MFQNLLILITILCYGTCVALQGISLQSNFNFRYLIFITISLLAILSHGILLYNWIETPLGQNLHFLNILSMVSWIMGIIVICSKKESNLNNLVILLYPVSILSIICRMLLINNIIITTANAGVVTHIFLSIFALSALGLAALQATIIYIQGRSLKNIKSGNKLASLPPLQNMEKILFKLIWLGVTFLTAAIACGIIYLDNIFAPNLLFKTLFTFTAWSLFSLLLLGRHLLGWRGDTAVRWTLSGMAALITAYLFSKLFII